MGHWGIIEEFSVPGTGGEGLDIIYDFKFHLSVVWIKGLRSCSGLGEMRDISIGYCQSDSHINEDQHLNERSNDSGS